MAPTSRKHRKQEAMTIPELRKAMNHISSYAHGLMKGGKKTDMRVAVKKFQEEWQSTFNKPLSEKAARDYLMHLQSFKGKKTMKAYKGKKGGAPLAGAPLAYRTEPGLDLPYGKFPAYVSSGFFLPMSDNIANCGLLNMGTTPFPGLGDNRVSGGAKKTKTRKNKRSGGGFGDWIQSLVPSPSALTFRPFAAENPPSTQHNLMMQWKGLPAAPSGQTYETTYNLRMPPGVQPYNGAYVPTRDLTTESSGTQS